jgi:hypothetical protein
MFLTPSLSLDTSTIEFIKAGFFVPANQKCWKSMWNLLENNDWNFSFRKFDGSLVIVFIVIASLGMVNKLIPVAQKLNKLIPVAQKHV